MLHVFQIYCNYYYFVKDIKYIENIVEREG